MARLPKDREHLVLDNDRLVHWVVTKKFHVPPYNDSYWDYYQQGMLGLIVAAIRFDETKGFKFSTYAIQYIMGSIQRYKRDVEPLIHYPRSMKDMLFKVIYYHNQGHTLQEIEEITGISGQDIRDVLNVSNPSIMRIEQPIAISNDDNSTLSDTISDDSDLLDEFLSQEHIIDCIEKTTQHLTGSIEKDVWQEWIYSLLYGEKLGQQELAKKYGVSQAQISRYLNKAKKNFQLFLNK